ncbi:hypothetical protein, variant [Aphanomyces invadans]|uniref:FH2 domain-containing protein n=1 Tax=Aphanomyces invadans TaxID=157072 RepID=A0A024TS83_9STRA|nr:hypothetical protein, variant [Aphanomyces invadans]XP_008874641.1 hypothetical protein H310_10145 [Aphanomyces invadans]ETV96863.1 hypothetical protein H310_10145 [Aphanomyces invadans]ETV96864.1 hypothetical protein, variant [Aphanomyces invadans]|eukprot:XP_008874640.1 hypothetical protein, variant [Aphanomyces invadans]
MNQLRKLASYVVDSSLKPSATSPPQQNSNLPPVPSYKHLDLTYVTTRLLVGGRAVDGPTDKMSCVNNATEMKAYLDAAHNGKYVVFNLTDDNADAPVISPQTLDFTWERDGGIRTYTPPADHIFRICYAIFAWLALDAENVALLYCHNGKTRSGVICACYFLFVRTVDDPMSALAQFYQKRLGIDTLTPEYVKRSMPISIQRFVSNFSIIMNAQTIPNPEPLLLKAIMFRALPVEMAPLVQLWDDDKMVFSTAATDDVAKPVIDWNPEDGFLAILWESGIPLDGGFSILCSFGDDYQADTSSDPTSRVLFRYMNSTWFLSAGLVTLKKPCLDMMKQYEHGFDEDNFSVDMVFHDNPTVEPKPFVPVNYTGNYAVKQGIVEMASHHTIAPDPSMYLNFIKTGFDATASTFALQRAENAPNLALDILHSEGISTIFTRLLPLPSHPSPSKLAATGAGLKGFTGSSSNLLQSTTDEAIRFHTTTAVATEWSASPNVSRRQSTHVDGILRGDVRTNVDLSRRHSSTDSAPPPRCKPSTTIEANSAVNYQEAVCAVCREEDYVLRPQLVRCAGGCQHFFHTGCAGLKKIPFGLTTMSDRANHAAYMKKFFSTWTCADCTCQHRADAPLPSDSPQSKSSPTKQKLEKLRLLLDEKGLSLDDLLRVADAKAPSGNSTPTAAAGADDASLAKYERMIDNGVPLEAAQNCMVRDGVAVDPSRLAAYVPSKPLAHQLAQHKQSDVLLLKDAIQFEGYFTMLQKGISKDAVKHKMKMCGLNPDILNLDPNSVYMEVRDKIEMLQAEYTQPPRSPPKAPSPQKPSTSPHKPTVSLPSPNKSTTTPATTIHRVKNPPTSATTASATSAGPPGKHEDEPEKAPAPDSPMADGKLTLKDDPTYGKYFKMLKLNIPQEAVRLKMVEHGVNPHALVLGPSALVSELNSTTTSPKPAVLKDDPIYAKYFKMLKLNIPEEAVRLKMKEHGVNEKALELGPDGLVSDLTTPDGLPGKPLLLKDDPVYGKYFKMLKMNIPEGAVKQKMIEHGVNVKALELGPDGLKAVRRKKLFWQALPEDRLRRASSTIWEDKDHNIQFDMDEIETLFFKETTVVKKPVAKPLARKQAVTLVDGKRAMNAAIALARIKQSYADLAKAILTYDAMGLTLEQLTTIHEFLPTDEEVGIVQRYSGDPSVLGEAEKFFAAIATVPRFAIKMDCLVSKQAFAAHVTDLTTSISNVIHACEDVKASRLLKLLLGTVLKLGNTLNGGDETEHAVRGFSVDSLLRLGHTKTNDQKTTVLHYLVRVLRKNQPHVLEFQTELQHVSLAAREPIESIDQLFSALDSDVKKTADECRRMQQDNAESSVVQSMQASIAASTHQLDALQQRMAAMKHELTTVFEYFGEDPAKKPTEFFLTLSSFCTAFDKAKQEVVAAEEAKQRAERSSQAMRPRATTDAAVMLDPVDKAKLISAKNSFSFHTTKLPSKTSTTTDLDRTASSRF